MKEEEVWITPLEDDRLLALVVQLLFVEEVRELLLSDNEPAAGTMLPVIQF